MSLECRGYGVYRATHETLFGPTHDADNGSWNPSNASSKLSVAISLSTRSLDQDLAVAMAPYR
jgi:hypothetical protein